ncbi:hypothetical protein BUALT_Bualt17G0041500 [Buddleja alternifolia]|uniref:Peptidase C1A papain C-terminal domain-containing protein n=1 Tax=Buddleja alternifolia TaxID=168488 RepID=A0AAV6WFB1_9LAMI|nr:hypothetical protein BUALT_Bualt17G0041500 [Buddleja alternifolia]
MSLGAFMPGHWASIIGCSKKVYKEMGRLCMRAYKVFQSLLIGGRKESSLLSKIKANIVGVFKGDCGTKLNYGVAIVGYGTTIDGTHYWTVKSWGVGVRRVTSGCNVETTQKKDVMV